MNQKVYDRLLPEHRKSIDQTTGPDRGQAFGGMWDAGEAKGCAYMVEGSVNIVQITHDVLDDLRGLLAPLL